MPGAMPGGMPMLNPFGMMFGGRAMGEANEINRAAGVETQNPFPFFSGMSPDMMNSPEVGNMFNDPAMMQMMTQMLSTPGMIDQMAAMNPMLQNMLNSNPMLRPMLSVRMIC